VSLAVFLPNIPQICGHISRMMLSHYSISGWKPDCSQVIGIVSACAIGGLKRRSNEEIEKANGRDEQILTADPSHPKRSDCRFHDLP
jgi:hypothetical protein